MGAAEDKSAGSAGNEPGATDPKSTPPAQPLELKDPPPPQDPPKESNKVKRVRVICAGPLGPKLLMKDQVTSDKDYVEAFLSGKASSKLEAVK